MTVQMFNPDTGKTADVHQDEVKNWMTHGWRHVQVELAVSLPPPPPAAPAAPARDTLKLKAK